MGDVLGAAVGFLFLSVLVAGVGVWMTRWVILPRAFLSMERTGGILRIHLSRMAVLPALLLPMAMGLVLSSQVVAFRDPFTPLGQDISLLLESSWGSQWLVGMVGSLLALVGGLLILGRRSGGWWLYSLGFMAAMGFSSLSGHAGGVGGSGKLLVVPADLLHLLAAGAWVGSLAAVLTLEVRWGMKDFAPEKKSVLPDLIPTFSPLALLGAGTLGTTGILAAWVHIPGPAALWSTGYGRILLLKLAGVAAILGLGSWNWKRVTPRLSTPGGPGAMRRWAGVELGIALLVILVSAVFIRTSPVASP